MMRQRGITQCVSDLLQLLMSGQGDQSLINETRAMYFSALDADMHLLMNAHALKMAALAAEFEYQGCLLQKAAWDESNKIQPEDRLKK